MSDWMLAAQSLSISASGGQVAFVSFSFDNNFSNCVGGVGMVYPRAPLGCHSRIAVGPADAIAWSCTDDNRLAIYTVAGGLTIWQRTGNHWEQQWANMQCTGSLPLPFDDPNRITFIPELYRPSITWSPDDARIAIAFMHDVHIVTFGNGRYQRITLQWLAGHVAWSPQNDQLAVCECQFDSRDTTDKSLASALPDPVVRIYCCKWSDRRHASIADPPFRALVLALFVVLADRLPVELFLLLCQTLNNY
jgi:hypothetical protein